MMLTLFPWIIFIECQYCQESSMDVQSSNFTLRACILLARARARAIWVVVVARACGCVCWGIYHWLLGLSYLRWLPGHLGWQCLQGLSWQW